MIENILLTEHSEEIRTTRALAQALIDAVPSPIYYKDRDGVYKGCNKAFESYHGISMDLLIGKSVHDILPAELADLHSSKDRFLLENPGTHTYESYIDMPDGQRRSVFVRKATFFKPDGEIGGLLGVLIDITDHREAEISMRSERNRFRTLLENAPIGIVLINKHGEFEYINPKFKEIFGYTRDDVPNGRIWFENAYPDPEYRRKVITTWKEDLERFAVGERKPWMFEVRCKDGNVKTINFIPVGLESGEHIMTCEDVTEAILAKEIIENSEQTLKAILAASPVGIALIYRSAISWANDAAYAMTGYDPGELDGRDLGIFYPDIEEWDRVKEEFVAQKEMETQWVRKDGAIIDVLIRIAPLKNYRDSFITTVEDISVRKNAVRALERSRLELERLDRAKTKAIHHISHELKTPLAVIQGSIKLFNKKMQKGGHIYESVRGYIETIERHLARLAGMQQESEKIFKVVREMEKTSFAADCERLWERIEAVSPVPDTIKAHWQVIHEWITGLQVESRDVESNNLFDVAKSVIRQVRQLAPARNVLIELHGKKNIEISMNPLILRDTISDLLKNAVEHTPDEGLIKVIIEKERDQAVLHVTDHGTGITPEDQKFIFDGLFHSVDTDNYTSSRPYSFGAGGKGLGLLKIKIYSQRYGFGLHMQSRRCIHLSANGYTCPGKISLCKYICDPADCIYTAGTTVTLTFEPIIESR